jgi:hypothetical protein
MKFNINDTIHYMHYNKPHSGLVLARMAVENMHNDWAYTSEQRKVFQPFGESGVYYATNEGIISERDAFPSKEKLVKSLVVA